MKLVTFEHSGKTSYGMVSGDGIIDAGAALGSKYPDLKSVLAANAVEEIAALASNAPSVALADVTLLPPITNSDKIYCIGINYLAHIEEMKRKKPDHPWVFMRTPQCQVGSGSALLRPSVSDWFDFEGELAVIIGKTAHRVSANDAMSHVAGYSIFNDGSIRDYQRHSQLFTAGKNFYKSGSFGPWMVTADDIPDPTLMKLETRLNGEVMQTAGLDDLCFDIPTLISYLSTIGPLVAGDVIVTGTPGGVGFGRDPYVWMKPGDTIEVEVSGIGVLSNPIRQEQDSDIVR